MESQDLFMPLAEKIAAGGDGAEHAGASGTLDALLLKEHGPEFHHEFKLLTAEADNGDADALYELGLLYRNKIFDGNAMPEVAFNLIFKAAMLGHPDAQHRLALMHWRGEGVTHSKQLALAWCRLAGKVPRDLISDLSPWESMMTPAELVEANGVYEQLCVSLAGFNHEDLPGGLPRVLPPLMNP